MNRHSRVDLGILLVVAICLLALWPFLSRPGLPQETDAELHVFRTVELAELLRGGAFYPRWAPDFYFGYGYPIFNYYAPLVYYLGAGLMMVPGVDAVLAIKLLFMASILMAGLGMYLLGRRLWGPRAGLLAAACYVYAPYVQFIDPLARGVLPESFSLALFPWVLWAFSRLAESPQAAGRSPTGRAIALAAALLAALICSHNLLALVLTGLLAGWLLWQVVWDTIPLPAKPGARLLLGRYWPAAAALLLGIGLAAFFWLPVYLERDAVQLSNVVSQGGHFDFHNHFLSLRDLLGASMLIDLGATEAAYIFNLGVGQWVLAAGGLLTLLVSWRRRPDRIRGPALYFGLVSAGLMFLLLPASTFLWDALPFLPYLQFPWRLLGPLAACLALLSASLLATGTPADRQIYWPGGIAVADGLLALALAAILALAIPQTFPTEWPSDFGPTDLAAINLNERKGRWLGTTSTGDYLPVGVDVVPTRTQLIVDAYEQGEPIDRVNRATLPAGTTVVQTDSRVLSWYYQIEGSSAFVFRLYHFYFPGWRATLDGQPIPIELARPEGFMTVDIPAGEHQLAFEFGDTPPRTLAWAISGLAALVLAVLVVFCRSSPPAERTSDRPVPRSLFLAALLASALVLAFRFGIVEPFGWLHYQSTGLIAEPAGEDIFFQVGDEIALIGYTWQPAALGREADLVLYWKALASMSKRYQVFVHLRDAAGIPVSQSDKLNPGDYPTSRWPLDRYLRDPHRLTIPADLPPGDYSLAVGIWDMAHGERLPIRDRGGSLLGDSILLGTITY